MAATDRPPGPPDTGQEPTLSGDVKPGHEEANDFVYFLTQLNAGGTSTSPKCAPRDAVQATDPQYTARETLVPSVDAAADREDETNGAAHAVPPPHSVPAHNGVPYASPPGAPMAYVPREIALATVVALMISANPWISAQELDNLIKVQHPALYDPYSVPGLIQMQLMIATNLRNGVKFVATIDPKLPRPPMPDPRPPAGPLAHPAPAPAGTGPRPPMGKMHLSPAPIATPSPRIAPMDSTQQPTSIVVREPDRGEGTPIKPLPQVSRAPKKRVVSPGVSSWSNFTQADFANKKKRKRRSLSPGAATQGLSPPVGAHES